MLFFAHICNHVRGQTGSKAQIFFSHFSLFQSIPQWPIADVHSCLPPLSCNTFYILYDFIKILVISQCSLFITGFAYRWILLRKDKDDTILVGII